MPSFPPRQEPLKKREQLLQKERELQLAIKRKVPDEKITQLAEKYRLAQLSLLKAKLHAILEKTYQKRTSAFKKEDVERAISEWTSKTILEIVNDIKPNLK